MDNFLNGGVAELEQAKEAVLNEARLNAEAEELEKALRSKEKDLNAQKKFMTDKIESQIKNRRAELEDAHDDRIQDSKKTLRQAQKAKKDAMTAAVNSRIDRETTAHTSENSQIRTKIRAEFKQWKIPGFANTSYYYALFAPKTVKDVAAIIITVLICFAVIPNVVCALISVGTFVKVLVYAGIIVLFVLIYLLISVWTKSGAKSKIIEKVRPWRNKYKENKKLIRKLSRNIRTDDDESMYGLEDFDSEIARAEEEVESLEANKAEALLNFDNQTAAAIRAEIERENMPVIEEIEAEARELKQSCAAKQAEASAATNGLTNNYIATLGAKNATPEKIDSMIALINDGKASTIMQALDIINGEIK